MKEIFQIIEIILAIVLVTVILLQQRGTGLGGAFGSEGFAYRGRRGIEQFLYRSTIITSVLFVAVAIVLLVVVRE